ncbi:MBL fold metallo-hydrolase [Thiohalophilus thiocyanatoxydans]|uniref:Glyoxylase-like metal-dependent hydrolase (Beta-lactamase superfamily II) n=1 Tax=Thiohalophilus thiocyanatoxydans TaxID=381308 RepID=A0A4R8IPL1_9GAMM|nr:MBL fold metallo-hydrolase [Thiohalophilus thiocyanatoxydans]TDX98131.1 glyoxylase-like metal-dependent hydrolase (beta-lactamase superfamily II) [Thiohalophilus thiocyanatoxydans]
MLFRQLIEPDSSTYTYLLHCPDSGKSALIDPVLDTVERDLKLLNELGLKLDFTLDTHVHADHLTGAKRLKELTGSRIVGPAIDQLPCTDIGVREGETFRLGNIEIHPLYTPGHTDHHHAYLIDNGTHKMLFSGDALLIEACGRTDFQSGDAATLYRSIHDKFFTLPDETLVYPCHDYEGRFVTTIAQEKIRNPRLGNNKSLDEFVEIMNNMDLPYPRKIDFAVPGNEQCGACPENVPDEYRTPCDRHDQG